MNEQVEAVLRTLPRKIKVGAYDWRIVLEQNDDSDALGETVWAEYEICIWPKQIPTPQLLVGTVLHELLHVIHDNEVVAPSEPDGYDEETVVLGFETGLISLFRDNPKLLTWIKRGLKSTNDGRI